MLSYHQLAFIIFIILGVIFGSVQCLNSLAVYSKQDSSLEKMPTVKNLLRLELPHIKKNFDPWVHFIIGSQLEQLLEPIKTKKEAGCKGELKIKLHIIADHFISLHLADLPLIISIGFLFLFFSVPYYSESLSDITKSRLPK